MNWNAWKLVNRQEIDIDWILEFPDLDWGFRIELVFRYVFKIEWLSKLPHKPWNFRTIQKNPDFNINWILDNINARWEWSSLHTLPQFTMLWLDLFPDKPWNYKKITSLPIFDIKYAYKFPTKSWDFKVLLNTYPEFKQLALIDDNLYYKKVDTIFTGDYLAHHYRKYFAARRIQRWWQNIYWNPRLTIRKRILHSQYDSYLE